MTAESQGASKPPGSHLAILLSRGQALVFLVAALVFLSGLQSHNHPWWTLGIATFLLALTLLLWNGVRIASDPHEPNAVWPRRLVVIGYLAALVMFLGSVLADQQVVPSVVFGSASLGMAILIAKVPSLVSRRPAA
jgi:hypothetical protein